MTTIYIDLQSVSGTDLRTELLISALEAIAKSDSETWARQHGISSLDRYGLTWDETAAVQAISLIDEANIENDDQQLMLSALRAIFMRNNARWLIEHGSPLSAYEPQFVAVFALLKVGAL